MFVYLVLSSSFFGGPSDLRKVYTNLADAIAQRKWIYDFVEKNDPANLDVFDVLVMRVETESGASAYIGDDGNVEGNEFTTKPLGL
jgi:hypothetical protein